jgi:drug/metabolite transporter (DMT)-like permease
VITRFLVAVPAAVLAAACFGTAGVLQHRATHQAKERRPLSPALLVDLIRIPGFLVAIALGALGFALQVLALRFGPLILVQPLLVTGVLFYIVVAAAFGHRHADRTLVAGVLMALAGLSGFLAVANPTGGHGEFSSAAALPLGLALLGVVVVCLFAAAAIRNELRVLPLAVATSVCYGVTAALVRSLTVGGLGWSALQQWETYAIVVIGPAGFLLNQNAFQKGMVGTLALGIITVGDPLTAIVCGTVWLGETIALDPWFVLGELLALGVMAAGVFLLAARAQHLAAVLQGEGDLAGGAAT